MPSALANDAYVVDASVAAKWYLRDEDLLMQADALINDWTDQRVSLVYPGHFPFEVTNALLRAARTGRLTRDELAASLVDFAGFVARVESMSPADVVANGARLAAQFGVNFFDACYLATARLQSAVLVTADEAFFRQARSQADVTWLGDYVSQK